MSGFRLAALDLDGTLVDSAPDLAHCLGKALGSKGLKAPSLAEAHRWIGDGVEVLVRRALQSRLDTTPDENLVAETLATFRHCYRDHSFVLSRVYPGVAETLETLRAGGLILGCITNKPEAFASDLLERAGLLDSLLFVHGADTFAARKPDPLPLIEAARVFATDPSEAVMIGDSINDLKAARGAGFHFVFAAYGYASGDVPELAACPDVIHEFHDLTRLLSA